MKTQLLEASKYLTIGKLGRTYGIKGWLKVHSATEPVFKLLDYAPWFIMTNKAVLPLKACKQQGNFLIGHIAGCDTPEEGQKFVNSPIVILQTQLPALNPDEYYWHDLIALEVYTLDQRYLGKIDSFLETGANDVMVITQEDHKRIMIPYVLDHIVKHIDLNKKRMQVDWDETWL